MSAAEQVELMEPVFERVDVSEFRQWSIGMVVTTTLLVERSEVKKASNGKKFVAYTLRDETGRVEAKQWDCGEAIEKGHVVKVRGKIEEFNGVQLNVDRVRVFTEDDDASKYVTRSRFEYTYLNDELNDVFNWLQMTCPAGELTVRFLMDDLDLYERFLNAPASAVYHHAGFSGLAEHTLSMCWLARKVGEHYRSMYEDSVNVGLLVAGVLLHDFAKALDVIWDGAEWVQTEQGKLLGHIPTCLVLLQEYGTRAAADPALVLELQHLVASHHGSLENGSPVVPRTVEAMLLHQIDMIDSRMAMWREATTGLKPGEWTEYNRPLRTIVRA